MHNTLSSKYTINFTDICNKDYNYTNLDLFIKRNTSILYSPRTKLGYLHGYGNRSHYTLWEDNTGTIQLFKSDDSKIMSRHDQIRPIKLKFSVIDKRFINNSSFKFFNDEDTKISIPTLPDDAVYISADDVYYYAIHDNTVMLSESSDLNLNIIRDSVPVILNIPDRSKNIKFNKYKREMIKEIKLKGSLNMFKELELNEDHPPPTIENILTDHFYQGVIYHLCLLTKDKIPYWSFSRYTKFITGTHGLSTWHLVELLKDVSNLFNTFRYTNEQYSRYIRVQS